MKTLKISVLALLLATAFTTTSCRKDDDKPKKDPVENPDNGGGQGEGEGEGEGAALSVTKVKNINAGQGTVKFDFSSGQTTTSNTDWDIAFSKQIILVNGGTKVTNQATELERTGNAAGYVANGTLNGISSVDTSKLKQDASGSFAITYGSGNGWYNYDSATYTLSPLPNKVLIFRTADNKYVKMVIKSYYKNGDASDFANARHYTFDYVYQPNGTTSF